MRRYIDANAILQRLPDDLPYKASVKRVLMQAPESDVAPKSEVAKTLDELMKEVNAIADKYARWADKATDDLRIDYLGAQKGALLALFKISELKKKYTEVEQ